MIAIVFKVRVAQTMLSCALPTTTDSTWACEWVPAGTMHHHLTSECPSRLVLCPQGCGQKLPQLNIASHLEGSCLMRVQECPLGCRTKLRECHLPSHLEESCPKREVLCPVCGDRVVESDLDRHKNEDGPRGCQAKLLRCRLGCGALVKQGKLDQHMQSACPKRYVTCSKCHNDRVWADEMVEQHPQRECPERLVVCPHEHCGLSILAKYLEEHTNELCSYRLIHCECGDDVVAVELDFHRRVDCQAALRYCTLGCGIKVGQSSRRVVNDTGLFNNTTLACIGIAIGAT